MSPEPKPIRRGGSHPLDAIEELIEACEGAFGANGDWADDEDVSTPGTGITFGQIRRARQALAALDA